VDVKTAARRYTDLQVEASLQLSIYSYATAMNALADQEDLRLRFDVFTKTKQPELHRYWTTRDRAANLRLFRLASEVLHASPSAPFTRWWAGTARRARTGAAAGCGGEQVAPLRDEAQGGIRHECWSSTVKRGRPA